MSNLMGEGQLCVGSVKYDLKLTIQGIMTLESEFNKNIAVLFAGYAGGIPPISVVARVLSEMCEESHKNCVSIVMKAGLENVYAALIKVIAESINPKGTPEGEASAGKSD